MKTTTDCPICGGTFTRIHSARDQPKYCSRSCANKAPDRMTAEIRERIGAAVRAELHPNWGGGQWAMMRHDGRVFVRVPNAERHLHPTIRKDGYIRRYHYVWNKAHPADPVRRGEVIHHLNEIPTDDRLDNLAKTVQSTHARGHGEGRKHSVESRALMSEKQLERRARERANRDPAWATEMCGTVRGYHRHRSLGEKACRPCREANAVTTKAAKARR